MIFCCYSMLYTVKAQNDPLYSQYMLNTLPLNPAYAGSQGHLTTTALYRKQWTNLEGSPSTQTFSIHSPLKNKKIALGISAFHDKISVTSKTGFYGVYAYRINFKNKSTLSLGLQAGLTNLTSRLSQLQTRLPDDPAVNNDRIIYISPNFGSGAYWYSEKFYLGISIPDLIEINSNKKRQQVVSSKQLFIHGGIVYKLSSQLKYMPGFLIKAVKGNALQYDLNNIIIINDVLWIGVSYRVNSSVNFLLQAQLTNQLSLGYSYDRSIGKYSNQFGSTHELKLSYRFVYFKDSAFMPRYF